MRRRRQLRDRFGPEYERAVKASHSARQAEADLQRRAAEGDRLRIRLFSAAQRDRNEQDWRQVQAEFVDVPGTSLARADGLAAEVMIDAGYPVENFDRRTEHYRGFFERLLQI
jgi:prophage tail gpP-like protein